METGSAIRAYQKILPTFVFDEPQSFSESFAQKRYLKKMEIPSSAGAANRKSQCWEDWIKHDQSLPVFLRHPASAWYRARLEIHAALKTFEIGPVDFSNGSEFTPTRGFQSIQQKLSTSNWDCTIENLSAFAEVAHGHPALKKAVRERLKSLLQKHGVEFRSFQRQLWSRLAHIKNHAKRIQACWLVQVHLVVNIVKGSRFATVRKNNEKDRPINVEGFCNSVTQRTIGLGLRTCLLDYFGIDLENGKTIHSLAVASQVATIDLKNASDSVLIALCEFLFPRWFMKLIHDRRSSMILGPDGNYHVTNKISAMGNGFTFELMTLILTALTRVYDRNSLVFGDDIIVSNEVAHLVIADLENVSFIVNHEKSFVNSQFRESCGANFHDDEGYIDSFDFEYPTSIGDCVSLHNKAYILGQRYASFRKLYLSLTRVIDPASRGLWVVPKRDRASIPDYDMPQYFATDKPLRGLEIASIKGMSSRISSIRLDYSYPLSEEFRFFLGYEYKPDLATKSYRRLTRRHWSKYYMYLHGGRVTNDIVTGCGRWRSFLLVQVGSSVFRWKHFLEAYPRSDKKNVGE